MSYRCYLHQLLTPAHINQFDNMLQTFLSLAVSPNIVYEPSIHTLPTDSSVCLVSIDLKKKDINVLYYTDTMTISHTGTRDGTEDNHHKPGPRLQYIRAFSFAL